MVYKKVYFDEENQRVRFTQTAPEHLNVTYEYVGKMTRVEFDLLIEVLWELYQDNSIEFKDFSRRFGDIRTFCDHIKELIQ